MHTQQAAAAAANPEAQNVRRVHDPSMTNVAHVQYGHQHPPSGGPIGMGRHGNAHYNNAAETMDFMRQNDPGRPAPSGGSSSAAEYVREEQPRGRSQNLYPEEDGVGSGGMQTGPLSPGRGRQTASIPGGYGGPRAGVPSGMYDDPSMNGPRNRPHGMSRMPGGAGGGSPSAAAMTGPEPGMVGGPPLTVTTTNGDGPAPPVASAAGGATGGEAPTGQDPVNFLSAPYQRMLSQHNQEDPAVARARSIMETHHHQRQQQNPLPLPYAMAPSRPKALAVEPSIPSARLGRRCILAQKQKRVPDINVGTHFTSPAQLQELQQQMKQGIVTVMCIVECVSCGNTLQTKKAAVLTQCPVCHKVFQTAGSIVHG